MIKNFRSRRAQDVYNGINSRHARQCPLELHAKAQRLFDQLDTAEHIDVLRTPPSNHLEKLRGDLKNYWSIRINKQWRIIFRWHNAEATDVDIIDYH